MDHVALWSLLQVTNAGFWPTTIAGWATLLLSVFTIAAGIFALGKFYAALNGLGARVSNVEKDQKETEGEMVTMQRQVDRVIEQHGQLLVQLGESKRSVERCSEQTVELGIMIGSKLDSLAREVNGMNLHLSQRLKAVETVLKLKEDA